jgi:hypothetical protein
MGGLDKALLDLFQTPPTNVGLESLRLDRVNIFSLPQNPNCQITGKMVFRRGMKCDLCGKSEATVHLTQTFGDTFRRLDLCEDCAKSHGINDPTGFSLASLMEGVKKQKKPSSGQED